MHGHYRTDPNACKHADKKIEIFNSIVEADGKKHVPITIYFRCAGIINIPDEKELIATMEEIRNAPSNVA